MDGPIGSFFLHGDGGAGVPLWVLVGGLSLSLGTALGIYLLLGLAAPDGPDGESVESPGSGSS